MAAHGWTHDQLATFAAGLHYVASVEGTNEAEVEVIEAFLRDAGAPELAAGLADRPFAVEDAVVALPSTFERRLFIKAAVQVAAADGVVSAAEREALAFLAAAFGLTAALDELLAAPAAP